MKACYPSKQQTPYIHVHICGYSIIDMVYYSVSLKYLPNSIASATQTVLKFCCRLMLYIKYCQSIIWKIRYDCLNIQWNNDSFISCSYQDIRQTAQLQHWNSLEIQHKKGYCISWKLKHYVLQCLLYNVIIDMCISQSCCNIWQTALKQLENSIPSSATGLGIQHKKDYCISWKPKHDVLQCLLQLIGVSIKVLAIFDKQHWSSLRTAFQVLQQSAYGCWDRCQGA